MSPTPTLTTLRIIWGSLLAAIGFYAFILAFSLVHSAGAPQGPSLVLPLAAVAVACAGVSVFLPRTLHRQAVLKTQLETVQEPAPDAFSGEYRQALPTRTVFADAKTARRTAMLCFQQPFILSVALSESVALFGLTVGIFGYGMGTAAPFFAAGFLLVASRFPTESRVFGPFEKWLMRSESRRAGADIPGV
jgi:hypothetical protein